MANLRVDLTEPLLNGMDIKFKAPCDCTAVTGLIVYAPDNEGNISSQNFTFKDAHGNTLTGLGDLFAAGVLVKVMVDTSAGAAYIQNADTNKYLENKIANAGSDVTLSSSVSSTSTTTAANSYAVKQAYDKGVSALSVADAAIPSSQKGAASGVAPLNASGLLNSSYLPFETGTITVTNPGYNCSSFSGNGHYIKLGDLIIVEINVFMKLPDASSENWEFSISGYPYGSLYGIGSMDEKPATVVISSSVTFCACTEDTYQSFKGVLVGTSNYL